MLNIGAIKPQERQALNSRLEVLPSTVSKNSYLRFLRRLIVSLTQGPLGRSAALSGKSRSGEMIASFSDEVGQRPYGEAILVVTRCPLLALSANSPRSAF
jgi:hypothetical protein